MGNRVSISFKQGDVESPTLFSHWDGREFALRAKDYVDGLKRTCANQKGGYPLGRREPGTVLVNFIQTLKPQAGNYYLGVNPNDGDNSDNGHFTISCD